MGPSGSHPTEPREGLTPLLINPWSGVGGRRQLLAAHWHPWLLLPRGMGRVPPSPLRVSQAPRREGGQGLPTLASPCTTTISAGSQHGVPTHNKVMWESSGGQGEPELEGCPSGPAWASTPKSESAYFTALCSHLHLWLYRGLSPTTISLWKRVNLQLQLIKFLGVTRVF